MTDSLIKFIQDHGDTISIQDKSILIEGELYYFTKRNDLNIYSGILKNIDHNTGYCIFLDIKIYNGKTFQDYYKSLSSPFIDKIYHF